MRTFQEHCIRKSLDLSGVWQFATDSKNVGVQEGWFNGFSAQENFVIPGMWNNESGYLEYEGAAWYAKKFYSSGGTLRFWFGGVMTQADVWLDGEKLGDHYGGFCEFAFIKRDVKAGWHTLILRVDNSFDEDSIPQKSVDWWHYGGITREIVVETLVDICVLHNKVDYTLSNDCQSANVCNQVELYNASNDQKTTVLQFTFENDTFHKEVTLNAGETQCVDFTFTVNNVRLWDIENPNLYGMHFTTGTDDLYDRTGFRKLEVKPDGIYLNDRRVEIRGVNRHEEHPEWGFAFPLKLMKKDLDIAFQMGCNAIRGSHYPNSRAFMDYCDETGMLFWSEIPIWGCGFAPETLGREKVLARGLEMHREMLYYYYNHPSIIIWGMHNEIYSDTPEGYEMSKQYYRYLKENGGNRIVTYASRSRLKDISFEFCDVMCVNLYLGWYDGSLSDWDVFLEKFREYRHQLGFDHKPVIFSEYGAAALYGYNTFDDIRWTEEYQAKFISYCLNLFHNDPMVCGSYVWQFADIRSCNEINRARGFNNKGILNEYRKPKLSYHAMKNIFLKWKEEDEKKKV